MISLDGRITPAVVSNRMGQAYQNSDGRRESANSLMSPTFGIK